MTIPEERGSFRRLCDVVGGNLRNRLVPPNVTVGVPLDLLAGALDNQHVLNRELLAFATISEGCIDSGLERGCFALAVPTVGGDDKLCASVVNAGAQAVSAEAAENDRVHRAQPGNRLHRDDCFGDHRHVNGNAVALADAECGQQVCCALDLFGELGIRDRAAVARLALKVERNAVAVACLNVPVEAVV